MGFVKEIWEYNFRTSMIEFDACLFEYPVISIDTEFPGFLRKTPRQSHDSVRYADLKHNVDSLKLIQLGLTLSNGKGEIYGTWEFNFRDFDVEYDLQDPNSIDFLTKNGINFQKIRVLGIYADVFTRKFTNIVLKHRSELVWVTFHGLYDMGYLLKLLSDKPLPKTLEKFDELAGSYFYRVYDVKYIAKQCNDGLSCREFGLNKLASFMGLQRSGSSHHAGSDSLLTAQIYENLLKFEREKYEGYLYGVDLRIGRIKNPEIILWHCPCLSCDPLHDQSCKSLIFNYGRFCLHLMKDGCWEIQQELEQ